MPVAVITRGSKGALAVDNETGEHADVPALPVEALDTTGAGDVFAAGFVVVDPGGLAAPAPTPVREPVRGVVRPTLRRFALGAGLG